MIPRLSRHACQRPRCAAGAYINTSPQHNRRPHDVINTQKQPPRAQLKPKSSTGYIPPREASRAADESEVTVEEYLRDQEEERQARRAVASRVFHTHREGQPIRINYVRYMNQYVLSVDGPREVAVDINALVAEHIRSKLLLDVTAQEEEPVHINEEPVEFLDFRLCRMEKLGDRIAAQVPMESIVRDMIMLGYAGYWKGGRRTGSKPRSHIRPCDRTAWVTRPDEVILTRYNRTLQMLQDYYLASSQPVKLKFIQYLLQYSAAMTLAHKHKTTITKMFIKHGMSLQLRYKDEDGQQQTLGLNLLQSNRDFARRPWSVPEGSRRREAGPQGSWPAGSEGTGQEEGVRRPWDGQGLSGRQEEGLRRPWDGQGLSGRQEEGLRRPWDGQGLSGRQEDGLQRPWDGQGLSGRQEGGGQRRLNAAEGSGRGKAATGPAGWDGADHGGSKWGNAGGGSRQDGGNEWGAAGGRGKRLGRDAVDADRGGARYSSSDREAEQVYSARGRGGEGGVDRRYSGADGVDVRGGDRGYGGSDAGGSMSDRAGSRSDGQDGWGAKRYSGGEGRGDLVGVAYREDRDGGREDSWPGSKDGGGGKHERPHNSVGSWGGDGSDRPFGGSGWGGGSGGSGSSGGSLGKTLRGNKGEGRGSRTGRLNRASGREDIQGGSKAHRGAKNSTWG